MSLTPAAVDPGPVDAHPKASWHGPRSAEYDRCAELRERTVAQDPDDDLAEVDWWAVIDDTPREREQAHRRAYRIKREMILPHGIWSAKAWTADGVDYVVVGRFEGYKPWWHHASEVAHRGHYAHCVFSPYDGDAGTRPAIPDEDYEDNPDLGVFVTIQRRP